MGDVGILATTAGLTFLVNNYVVSEKEMKQYTGHLAGLLASSLFYPFQVGALTLNAPNLPKFISAGCDNLHGRVSVWPGHGLSSLHALLWQLA